MLYTGLKAPIYANFGVFWSEPGRNTVLKIDWAGGGVRKPPGRSQRGLPGAMEEKLTGN